MTMVAEKPGKAKKASGKKTKTKKAGKPAKAAKKAKASKRGGKRGPRTGPSRRAQQRELALKLGHGKKVLEVETLRDACMKAGIYNAPNFAQDMTKDSALFEEVKSKAGKREGWRLTTEGKKLAADLVSGKLEKEAKAGRAEKADKPSGKKTKAKAKAPKAAKAAKPAKAKKPAKKKAAKVSEAPAETDDTEEPQAEILDTGSPVTTVEDSDAEPVAGAAN
jgi:hypothetical protein